MKILFPLILIAAGLSFAQDYKIEKLTGSAKILNQNDKWVKAEVGSVLSGNSFIVTDNNSFVKISDNGVSFSLKESSAVLVSNIKQMTLNELLLALAMEDILNAPRKKENNNGKTTAVYGIKEGSPNKILLTNDFGLKRINGAFQLAQNGFRESAIVTAKEIFRKYPEIKKNAEYRFYFAGLLYDIDLYEEAYDEFISIKDLKLSEDENTEVEKMVSLLNKKLVRD